MRVALDDLAGRLAANASKLPKLILLNGNEPLLIEEALDGARAALRELGFSERIKYQLEAGFDWSALMGAGQSMSLFSERRIIELRVPKSLGAPGTKAITEYCGHPSEDDVLIVMMPALDKRQRSAKWVSAIESIGWVVDGPDVGAQQFPAWLKKRLQSRSLRVESGVVEMMTAQLEGNVLAAAQEVDKLQVLAPDGAVTLKLVTESLADQARFDVYALTDSCLAGDLNRALRIQQRLQSEGVEPVIVVWSLVREIRLHAVLAAGLASGESRSMLFKQNRVWSKREPIVNAALARLGSNQWYDLLERAAHLDQTVKGQRYQEVGTLWFQIEQLCARLCGVELSLKAKA
ncbi:DNA polymerase III subunit delta [Arenicella xantha]|uniref:DNA polymerase III subunit delta n=1 Tax=Arenicella xantha TaxID=644221 RepID=A0A395JNN0_9GAMM|nr:DNA polymerase III subunit delta [Arenicella xantha]RBP53254.1 DNA polymerase III delta subunit [Arenicella xantha]